MSTRASYHLTFLLQESNNYWTHIPKGVWIPIVCFVGVVFAFFFLSTALYYYRQWKRSRRPLLSGGPLRGWRLR